MCFSVFSAYYQTRKSNKLILIIGGSTAILMVLISSFVQRFSLFVLFYGIGLPSGVGISYFVPLMCGWEWLPSRKGLVSGIILMGFGFASFFFGFIAMALVNPDNVLYLFLFDCAFI